MNTGAAALVEKASLWIVAATPWEIRPLAGRLGLKPAGAAFEGALNGHRSRALALGMGAEKARAALDAASASTESPRLLLHTGFAGAAQPGLASGTLVLDLWGVKTELRDFAKVAAAGQPYQIGRIGSSPRVLATAAEKAAFGASRRVAAVDMENEAVQAWARERGVACLSAKAILDALEDELPSQAPASESAADVARYVAERWRELPLLFGLWRRQRAAVAALESFLKSFTAGYDGLL